MALQYFKKSRRGMPCSARAFARGPSFGTMGVPPLGALIASALGFLDLLYRPRNSESVTGVTQSVAGQEKSSRQSPAGGKRMVPLDMEKPLSHLGGVCPRQQAHPERPCLLW